MELSEKQQERIDELVRQYNLRLVLLFGSRATGHARKKSDYDIAYLPKKKLDFEDECRLNSDFTGIFQFDRVDTVDMRNASPLLFYAMFENPTVLYQEDDLIFPTYQSYAFKKYVETKPLRELAHQQLLERIQKHKH